MTVGQYHSLLERNQAFKKTV